MLYKELLDFSKVRLEDFFSNVSIFENQFTWSEYNSRLYKYMYEDNSYDAFYTVKDLKELVPELKPLCKKCGNYFIPQRNKSIPKYDVIMGKQLEEILMDFLSLKLNTKVIRADLQNRSLPDFKVLKSNGSIAAYFELKFHGAPFVNAIHFTGRYCYEGSATLDTKKIMKQLELIDDGLDGPVFYIHWLEYPCLKGVFYETSEQVKEYLNSKPDQFKRAEREGDKDKNAKSIYLKKAYFPLLKMKSFESLLVTLKELL